MGDYGSWKIPIDLHPLFRSPGGYPNGIAVAPEGLWICEQKSDNAVLVDWKGKLLKTLKSESKNTSGIAYGDRCVWMAEFLRRRKACSRLIWTSGSSRIDRFPWDRRTTAQGIRACRGMKAGRSGRQS